jgi:CBS domain-containing protein
VTHGVDPSPAADTPAARAGTVRDWMTHQPVTVPDDCPVRTALATMRSSEIRHLLILEDARLIGILSTRDLGRLLLDDPRDPRLAGPVRAIMTEAPVAVTPETPVAVAARALLDARIGALPVRDGGRVVGIFTTADALEALLRLVEGSRD